uniref:glycerol-3-phosphate 1-O-acyltransferase PlsB n=1 Tax=Ningiella ruwaisensis TaxID=2364274 RepID=UPI00109FF8C9|nr:glycerol-3-phosphate 1-O-acyltransferase PlsB [Ningiella ruwaisensis]
MQFIRSAFRFIMSKAVGWLVSVKSVPANIEKELGIDRSKPIIYLLQTESFTDQVALEKSTKALSLPDPFEDIIIEGTPRKRRYFLDEPQGLLSRKVKKTAIEDIFTEYFQLHRQHKELDLQVVPVFISWGRSAGKEKSGFAQLMAIKASPNWLRKFFIVLFFGRDNFVSYSPAVSTRQMAQLHGSDKQIAQKLVRVARTHFQRKRQTLSGPTLLERQTLYNSILGAESVKAQMHEEAEDKNISVEEAKKRAVEYIDEIAADYREGLIRLGDRVLTRIWNKIYDGIDVGHAKRVRELARNGHEIIYVPCHRSHMDYLLLTYVIYHEGLVTPHIAAGINLNFWPAGGIFRRCGAFFLRRSFAGNKLYTAVFREYLELLFNKGYSVKYFPEGGRSRTGRLLPPKTGMLAMTLQAITKGVNRPVSVVPVYIGYEHVMEVKSYMKELKGKSKKKESPTQVFSAIRKLKNYGHGFVNFGEPIQLNQFLDESVSDWRDSLPEDDRKPKWLTPVVNKLADSIMRRINRAAALNGTALVALCLLSSKTQIMSKKELVRSIDDYLKMFKQVAYSEDATLPHEEAAALVDRTLALNRFEQSEDKYGSMVSPKNDNAVLLTFYRNNILHMFSLPSLIMTAVFAHKQLKKSDVLALVDTLFPLLKREFFMHQSIDAARDYVDGLITYFIDCGMLLQSGEYIQAPDAKEDTFHSAWLLSRAMQETWQRYAIVLNVLEREKSIGRAQLEKQSQVIAERLSALFGMHSPEFYDKNVLASFVNALRENKHVQSMDNGELSFSQSSLALKDAIMPLVWPEIIQHLAQIEDAR